MVSSNMTECKACHSFTRPENMREGGFCVGCRRVQLAAVTVFTATDDPQVLFYDIEDKVNSKDIDPLIIEKLAEFVKVGTVGNALRFLAAFYEEAHQAGMEDERENGGGPEPMPRGECGT